MSTKVMLLTVPRTALSRQQPGRVTVDLRRAPSLLCARRAASLHRWPTSVRNSRVQISCAVASAISVNGGCGAHAAPTGEQRRQRTARMAKNAGDDDGDASGGMSPSAGPSRSHLCVAIPEFTEGLTLPRVPHPSLRQGLAEELGSFTLLEPCFSNQRLVQALPLPVSIVGCPAAAAAAAAAARARLIFDV